MFFTIFEPPPRDPRQSPRSYNYSVARSRAYAYSEFCKYHPCARRLCTWIVLKYLLRAPARARARIAERQRRSVILPIASRPLCVRYVLTLRALASTRARLAAATAAALAEPPPCLDPNLEFNTLERYTPWMARFEDDSHNIKLYHRHTDATRIAPWIVLRTLGGRVYFANLVTRVTRWTPPPGWLDGWISFKSPFDSRSWYARQLLPRSLASLQVEGGCPYLPYSPFLR